MAEEPSAPDDDTRDRVTRYDYARLAPTTFFALFALTAFALVYVFSPLIADLVLSFVLVGLFRPTWRWLDRKLGGRPWLASSIVTLLILLLVLIPFTFVAATIVRESVAAFESIRAWFVGDPSAAHVSGTPIGAKLQALAKTLGFSLSETNARAVTDAATEWGRQATLKGAENIVNRTIELAFHFVIVLVCVFYILVDADRLRDFVFRLSPLPDAEDRLLVDKFKEVARGILVGNGIASVMQGVLAGLAMALAGLPSAVFWSAVMSLLAFLPIVGISVVTIPATIYLLVVDRPLAAFIFIAFCTAQGLFIENVVKSHLIGQRARMHDLLVLLGILGGIAMFGLIGLLYGPLLVAAFLTLSELYFSVYHARLAESYRSRSRIDLPP